MSASPIDPPPGSPAVHALDPAGPVPEAWRGQVLALGNFDGVHRGHLELLRVAGAIAADLGTGVAALTFEPHPRSLFRPQDPVFRLTPLPLKAELLQAAGARRILVLPFDRTLAAVSAESFVDEILLGRLGARGLVCGYDFHFGHGRLGSPEFLVARAGAGRPVAVVEAFAHNGAVVSATAIRRCLEAGDVAAANELLGRDWAVRGTISHGDKRGRELGYPTANMLLPADCKLRHGIYAVRARIDGRWHQGVASFGRRPTFDDGAPRLETFVFDFSGDLYGKTLDIAFVAWLRGEEKFDSLQALIVQMDADSARARAILSAPPRHEP